MVPIPERVVGVLCARDVAAVEAWWAALPERDAAGLVSSWAEGWLPELLDGESLAMRGALTLAEVEVRREEARMWTRELRDYAREHPERAWPTCGTLRMLRPPRWRQFRRYDAHGVHAWPSTVRSLSWQRSARRLVAAATAPARWR